MRIILSRSFGKKTKKHYTQEKLRKQSRSYTFARKSYIRKGACMRKKAITRNHLFIWEIYVHVRAIFVEQTFALPPSPLPTLPLEASDLSSGYFTHTHTHTHAPIVWLRFESFCIFVRLPYIIKNVFLLWICVLLQEDLSQEPRRVEEKFFFLPYNGHLQAKERGSEKKSTLPTTWSRTCRLQDCGEVNFCGMSHRSVVLCRGIPGRLIQVLCTHHTIFSSRRRKRFPVSMHQSEIHVTGCDQRTVNKRNMLHFWLRRCRGGVNFQSLSFPAPGPWKLHLLDSAVTRWQYACQSDSQCDCVGLGILLTYFGHMMWMRDKHSFKPLRFQG